MNYQALSRQSQPLLRAFHVMAKPVGSQCNLECDYCYYLYKRDLLSETPKNPMGNELLEEFIRRYIAEQDAETIIFTWHGGEPTMQGLDYYRKVVQLQQKYANKKRIENNLQTNGLLLDDVWCEFLRENRFLVGLSIDGPRHLHDLFRKSKGGKPTFDDAYRAARLMRKHDVVFNTLTVINSINARHPNEVYQFLVDDLGSRRLQWLPCVELKTFRTNAPMHWNFADMPIVGTGAVQPGHRNSIVTEWSVASEDWGTFLCKTFDLWMKDGLGTVLVNWFESLVGQWMQQPAQVCSLAEVCGRSLVLEQDGSLYSCDRFVYPEFKVGHLNEKDRSLADIVYCPQQRKFGCQKRDQLSDYCKQCPYRFACNGDCPKNRFVRTPDGKSGFSYLCSGFKHFFAHADPHLRRLVAKLR